MRILFTICGRAGSKGVKNKNLKDFLGTPIVYYSLAVVIEYCKTLAPADKADIVLNTDSERLIEIVNAQDAIQVFPIRRTEDLSGDAVPKVAVIKDCLAKAEAHFNTAYDVVVDLDITSPLRTVQDIANAIDRKIARPDTDVVYSVAPSRRNPYFNMVKETDGFSGVVIPSQYTARQQAPAIYDMNASIYAYSPAALKSKPDVGFFNSNCYFSVMKDTAVLDIDSEEDLTLMALIAEYLFRTDEDLAHIYKAAAELKK